MPHEGKWSGRTPAENSFEKRARFETMGVEYMTEECDSWKANDWGGSVLKLTTTRRGVTRSSLGMTVVLKPGPRRRAEALELRRNGTAEIRLGRNEIRRTRTAEVWVEMNA